MSIVQKFRLIIVLWVMWLLGTLPAAAGGFKPASGRGVPDVYTVVLKEGVAHKPHGPRKELPAVAQVAQELARAHGGRVEEVWEHALQGFVVRMPEARARKLAEDPRVLAVEQDFALSAPVGDCYYGTPVANTRPLPSSTASPQLLSCSDPDPLHDTSPTGPPLCTDNWGIDRIDQLSAARENRYFFVNNGRNPSTTVHIYVMDTGILASHREFLGANGISRVTGGVDARFNPPVAGTPTNTNDCYGHGTHVAGIIAGRTYGVAKDAILHPVRIIGRSPLQAVATPNCPLPDNVPDPFVARVARGLNWISAHVQQQRSAGQTWPAIINWSGGNDLNVVANGTLGMAVQGVLGQGIVLVQAAGNQSPDFNPAQPSLLRDACDWSFGEKYPGVIVAGGMDEYDGRWTRRPSLDPDDARSWELGDYGSNAGACVDVWAPASHVISTNKSGNDLSCRLSGTSMAAPHVTGVVAVYLEDHPNATISEVEQALRSRGTWNALRNGASDPNTIGPASDNVVVYSDTRSLGPDLPPVATFTVTCQGRTCSFNATGSTDDFGITSYHWQFGDGTSGTSPFAQHRFPPGFNGRVTLTVTDGAHADHFSKAVAVQAEARDAQVFFQNVPASMVAGASYPVRVTLKNVGTLTWSPIGPQCNAYRLGSANPRDNSAWGRTRVELPAPVAPGGEVTFDFTITAPSRSDSYNFQWQMVQECVTWFGDPSPNVVVPVTIFADVPLNYWVRQYIDAIYYQGITAGCAANPLRYCPEDGVSRAQAATFLIRAKGPSGYVPPACTTPTFSDVPCTHWAAPWVNEFARRGITVGCGGGNYCPDFIVDRGTMAYFLLATLGITPPTSCTGMFSDVPCNVWYAPWVEELYRRGITAGCGGGQYCPTAPASRAQMAVFLVRTFGVPFP